MVALNAELQGNDGSERQLRCDDGSERQSDEWTTALNVERKTNNGFERQNWESMVALNTERSETWLWTPKSGTQIGTSN